MNRLQRYCSHATFYLLILILAAAVAGCSGKPKPPVQVKIQMKKYTIKPAEVHLKQGEVVEFEVTAIDVQHGFDVPDLNISESVQPGMPAKFAYKAERKGTFSIECGIICGPGHDDMRGKIIVE